MKTKLSPFTRLVFAFCILHFAFCSVPSALSQIPQGFNYQAIARDASGTSIVNTPLPVRITLQADSLGTMILWQELHQDIVTNNLGMINLVVGKGARQVSSTVPLFSDIDWSVSPKFIKTEINYSGWKTMGVSRLWSVPYSLVAEDLAGSVKRLTVTGETDSMEEALFEVKNKTGQTVFAVYNEGVRVYVSDGDAKGLKGGFAVGGFGTDKAESTKYMFVNKDSVRFYLDTNPLTKKLKSGFAVGGYDLTKGLVQNFLEVSADSVRIYIDNNPDEKKVKGGFAVGGFDATKGTEVLFTSLTPENYFIGHEGGVMLTTGRYNSALGYQSGRSITAGQSNAFLGYQSGYLNSTGNSNLFLGYQAGYSNTTGSFNSFAGYMAGYANTEGANNSFLGSYSGTNNTTGSRNTFIGYLSGYLNSTGESNAFIGYETGRSNINGAWNVFVGYQAGRSNNSGSSNIFIGNQAGEMNQTPPDNVFIGYLAGQNHTSGANNIYIGSRAGINDESGAGNIFLGYRAGESNTSGYSNVFISTIAGYRNTSGYQNVLIGDQAGTHNTTGYQNVIIGREAGLNSTGSRNIMIGYQAGNTETGSDRLHIGQGSLIYGEIDNDLVRINGDLEVMNSSTFKVYRNGNVGIGLTPAYKLDVAGNRIRLFEPATGDWIAMRTDGGTNDYLDLSFGGGSLVIQGNTTNEHLIINPSMNRVGIRTWTPQYDLDVNGSIRATGSVYYGGSNEAADGTAYSKPDYVFGDDYPLFSVENVKEFLDREKHLPWVTSAEKEKKENGSAVNMTRMAFETLETIENLQLQIIMMNDQMRELREMLKTQQEEINRLRAE